MKFTQGMFGSEWNTKKVPGLNLGTGQMRYKGKITHNSGWYNASGEKLGWGDIGADDVEDIRKLLDPNDVFILLTEQDSWWYKGKNLDKMVLVDDPPGFVPSMEKPGKTYVLDKAWMIICPDGTFAPHSKYDHPDVRNRKTSYTYGGIEIRLLDRSEIQKRIRAANG